MARFDTIKQFRWRSMTEQEVTELREWLALRRYALSNPEVDPSFVMPEAPSGVHTVEGAVHWAVAVLWQDSPWLLILGSVALLGRFALAVWNITRTLTG